MTPSLSIVIPTCARPVELGQCLTLLIPQVGSSGEIEIIVSDDGPPGRTCADVVSSCKVARRIEGPRKGPGANRNAGARAARGEWILFLDDDCLPDAGVVAAYRAAIHNGQAQVLYGPTRLTTPLASLLWEGPSNPDGAQLISCNFAVRRDVFLSIGGFDETYPMAAFEDTDLEARLRLSGITIAFLPEAGVHHPPRPVPPVMKMAKRWEARVISTWNLGAGRAAILSKLPRHVLAVILSRFRDFPVGREGARAALRFVAEYVLFLGMLPGWIARHSRRPRSAFWTDQVRAGRGPANFGL